MQSTQLKRILYSGSSDYQHLPVRFSLFSLLPVTNEAARTKQTYSFCLVISENGW